MTATTSDATLKPPVMLGTSALPGYLLLFAALFCAYGTESAYLPAFLQSHGLAIEKIGTVLAAGTVVRIVAGPMLGRLADRVGTRRLVLAVAAALAGIIGSTYLVAWGFVPLLLVCMAHFRRRGHAGAAVGRLGGLGLDSTAAAFNTDGCGERARRPSWAARLFPANSSTGTDSSSSSSRAVPSSS